MGRAVGPADVRAFIARRLLKQEDAQGENEIGSITLHPHQLSAVDRMRCALKEFGGALLCDQVGMGKTFVALALCANDDACVVAPAVLEDMWQRAAASANKQIAFASTESLSRGGRPEAVSNRMLIVDEAHHFRNPGTRRYAALAKLVANRPVVLLTATPIHNRKKDLAALLALFLGSSSETLTQSELGRLIIRREIDSVSASAGLPHIEPPVWCDLNQDEEIARLLLDLPPPLPPRDGGDGGALVIHSLVRQWASSNAALEGALARRHLRSCALISALEGGTYPSESELTAWASAEDCVQLAFAEFVASKQSSTDVLLRVVRRHCDAISTLRRLIGSRSGVDAGRANVIRAIRAKHHGIRVVAFSQYAETVDALFLDLSRDGYVAALTGQGARVSGGRITRREAIGRFAPVASGVKAPKRADVVTLLLTTDLLSEGVNLQDAGVVIHLDLPWTPARMEQRLGRVARMGSPHERVFSYVMRPPASAETLIHLERVLREKVTESSEVVDVFPSLSLAADDRASANTPRLSESIRSILERWSTASPLADNDQPCFASVASAADGFLALCEVGSELRFLAHDGERVSDDPSRVLRLMKQCFGAEVSLDQARIDESIVAVGRYFAGLRITDRARTSKSAHVRRAGLKRIAKVVSRARPHERSRVVSLASSARDALLSRMGAEGERRLESLSTESIPDDRWMEAVSEIGGPTPAPTRVKVVAAILLVSTCAQ
ncbi:MAG TPA: DEAD/DEAH box helicase [Gemmatimonadaceae bacterium]|nr:DEAD/DEAH box helicase [Gemmatimonadaceae bacterium]